MTSQEFMPKPLLRYTYSVIQGYQSTTRQHIYSSSQASLGIQVINYLNCLYFFGVCWVEHVELIKSMGNFDNFILLLSKKCRTVQTLQGVLKLRSCLHSKLINSTFKKSLTHIISCTAPQLCIGSSQSNMTSFSRNS